MKHLFIACFLFITIKSPLGAADELKANLDLFRTAILSNDSRLLKGVPEYIRLNYGAVTFFRHILVNILARDGGSLNAVKDLIVLRPALSLQTRQIFYLFMIPRLDEETSRILTYRLYWLNNQRISTFPNVGRAQPSAGVLDHDFLADSQGHRYLIHPDILIETAPESLFRIIPLAFDEWQSLAEERQLLKKQFSNFNADSELVSFDSIIQAAQRVREEMRNPAPEVDADCATALNPTKFH